MPIGLKPSGLVSTAIGNASRKQSAYKDTRRLKVVSLSNLSKLSRTVAKGVDGVDGVAGVDVGECCNKAACTGKGKKSEMKPDEKTMTTMEVQSVDSASETMDDALSYVDDHAHQICCLRIPLTQSATAQVQVAPAASG